MRDAWVLKLKEDSKSEGMHGDFYMCDEEYGDGYITNNINEATIIPDKQKEIEAMKAHEKVMIERYGDDAVMNFGYTNMMKNFDFVEVEIEEVES